MVHDPVRQGQLYLRRAGGLLRRGRCDGATRDWNFAKGRHELATLAAEIESVTGCTLESRRALDFGCGGGRLALPLAERCQHVYGLDISPGELRVADRGAKRMNLSNVEWLNARVLAELSGRYDLVLSVWVFQHIPSREGEQILATLLRGLRRGGVGAIQVTIRPHFDLTRCLDRSYAYRLMNSYSLNRIGRLLADGGITGWHVKWQARPATVSARRPNEAVMLIFRKD